MSRRIPPFASLKSFEAAARHCNLRLASEELFLSISAVSHQIKSLEQFLGVQLYHRRQNALELTAAGEAYMKELADALDIIAKATATVEAVRATANISVYLQPSLAVYWLMPLLPDFYRAVPDVDVTILSPMDPLSFQSGLMEVAVRYLSTGSTVDHAVSLFDEHIFPICSNQYAEDNSLSVDDFCSSNITVIKCQTCPNEWDDWFNKTDIPPIRPFRILSVDNRALAMKAVESGLGVAMGRTPFVSPSMKGTSLMRLTSTAHTTGMAYKLCSSDSATRSPVVKQFTKWLTAQAELVSRDEFFLKIQS